MNTRAVFLLLTVAIVLVKGNPAKGESLWAKASGRSRQETPARHFFGQQMKSFPGDQKLEVESRIENDEPANAEVKLNVEPVVEQPVKEEKAKPVKVKMSPNEEKPKKLFERSGQEQTRKKPLVKVPKPEPKERASGSAKPKIPIFAQLILGDPANPKLATPESLRGINWRSTGEANLELPTKDTIPLTKELLRKTEELLRVFQELQAESNGFVDDVIAHNENAESEYIGYYN